jgi:hypothetical protein
MAHTYRVTAAWALAARTAFVLHVVIHTAVGYCVLCTAEWPNSWIGARTAVLLVANNGCVLLCMPC